MRIRLEHTTRSFVIGATISLLSLLPYFFVYAQGTTLTPTGSGGTSLQPTGGGGTTLSPTGFGGNSGFLQNPLKFESIQQFLSAIIDIIILFAIPLIIFMIMYAGFLYVTAQGNEEKVKTAHKALLYPILGGVLILGAKAILTIISETVKQLQP